MNNTNVKNPGIALLLLVWMLPGYGEPAIAFTCGEEHIISDDGIFNPYEVQLAELHRVTSAPLPPAQAQSDSYPIPPENFCSQAEATVAKTGDRDATEPQKISPVLKRWLDEKDSAELHEIIVQFNDDLQIQRLPVFDTSVPPGEALDKRQRAIQDVKHKRSLVQARYLTKLKSQVRFKHTGSFWLVNAVTGKVRLDKVRRIARMQFVTYLQPAVSGESPPSNENHDDDVEDGRAAINSAAYFDMNLTEGRIGLIDTGVTKAHEVFSPDNHLGRLLDCVNGGPECDDETEPLFNSGDVFGHGTSTAAILMGSTALGPEFRGVTGIKTDSWRVYGGLKGNELNSAAVLRALERGVQDGIDLWVVQVQANETELGAIANAADSAYETGAIIIAANGNEGNVGTVRSPAFAHKVIGVGGFHVVLKQTVISQSRGPAPDDRYKPDIQGPSHTETAHGIDNDDLWVYEDTSGATPYVGSAAMLARNWLGGLNEVVENGQVYAFVILYGQQVVTDNDDLHNKVGAGPLVMATDGRAWWGKTVVGHGMTIDVPLNIGTNMHDFDIALWWPESDTQEHSDINVFAIDPQGAIKESSQGEFSVFERAAVTGDLESGTWKLQIRGHNVPQGQQLVYWAAVVKNG